MGGQCNGHSIHDGSVGFVKRNLYHMRYIPAGAVGGARWQMTVQVTSSNRWKHGTEACRYMGSRRRPEMKHLSTTSSSNQASLGCSSVIFRQTKTGCHMVLVSNVVQSLPRWSIHSYCKVAARPDAARRYLVCQCIVICRSVRSRWRWVRSQSALQLRHRLRKGKRFSRQAAAESRRLYVVVRYGPWIPESIPGMYPSFPLEPSRSLSKPSCHCQSI